MTVDPDAIRHPQARALPDPALVESLARVLYDEATGYLYGEHRDPSTWEDYVRRGGGDRYRQRARAVLASGLVVPTADAVALATSIRKILDAIPTDLTNTA